MDFAEEQEMELQALESIYVDELKVEGKDPVVLRLLLKPPSQEEESHVAASLVVSMPPSYPEEMPELQVIAEKNLDPSQIQELMELAEATARENIGTAMVFTIAEAIKDWLVDHNVKKMSVHELAVQRKQATKGIDNALAEDESDDEKLFSTENTVKVDTEEEAERRAHYGTPFSMELFEAWRVDYEAYVLEKDELERKHKEDPERANRPTGKHFFEQRSAQHLSTLSNGNVGQEDSKEVYWFDDELYNDDDISE